MAKKRAQQVWDYVNRNPPKFMQAKYACPDCGLPVETEGQYCGDCQNKPENTDTGRP